MTEVVSIRFKSGGKSYFFDPGSIEVETGQHVIVETAKGLEFGECIKGNYMVNDERIIPPLRPVIRLAGEDDLETVRANDEKEARAYEICAEKIREHKLDMKLVDVEYNFEGNKILFFFTADGRVDFRELVKDLASVFRTRIELRQIGVRDKAKMLGGLGICGKEFCCSQFMDEFQPVSIKMAKTQSLSLNPTKISGTCGRLMCCLQYEQEAYEGLVKNAPKLDSYVNTPDGNGTITDVNLLRQRVKVRLEGHIGESDARIGAYPMADITFIKTGKQRRADLIAEAEAGAEARSKAESRPSGGRTGFSKTEQKSEMRTKAKQERGDDTKKEPAGEPKPKYTKKPKSKRTDQPANTKQEQGKNPANQQKKRTPQSVDGAKKTQYKRRPKGGSPGSGGNSRNTQDTKSNSNQ